MKPAKALCVILLASVLAGCAGGQETLPPASAPVRERPRADDGVTYELLQDLNFSRGFAVSAFHSNSSGGVPRGYLDYAGAKAEGEPVWTAAQWGCQVDFLSALEKEGGFVREGSRMTYDDGAKLLSADTEKTGNIRLSIKGSREYGRDENGNWLDRTDPAYNWPNLLIGQEINCSDVSDAEKLIFEVEYTVNSCDRLPSTPVDPDMHAAQFQWFITFTNKNPESPGYGEAMWFGFSMFDTRSLGGTPSGFAAYDGGKEDNTGMFIYTFSLESAAYAEGNEVTLPTAVVGQRRTVKVDILPFVEAGLAAAEKRGAMKGTKLSDLMIGSTNIGIELPGSYDVDVQIHSMNFYKTLKIAGSPVK